MHPTRSVARLAALTCAFACAVTGAPRVTTAAVPVAVSASRAQEADALFAHALSMLERRSIEARRTAIADLERATTLDPAHADAQLLLARTYLTAGFRRQAMRRFERVVALSPGEPEARYGLAQVWRRDWLKYLEPRSLERAIEHAAATTRLDARHTDAWLMLSALHIEHGDLRLALAAAEQANLADPQRAEVRLALGSAHWRLGEVEAADQAFRSGIPRLRERVRERFVDIAPLATELDTMTYNRLDAAGRAEYARRFWVEHDPDLATEVNEAQLEYWARVSQAYFLFFDPKRREWDQRGEVYVRYGPPRKAEYNPVGQSLMFGLGTLSRTMYPANVLVWGYPDLGFSVSMQDRVLSEYYQLPISLDRDMDPRPDPDSLRRQDLLEMRGGRAVFPPRPPGARALPLRGQLAVFAGSGTARVFAGLETPAGLGDSSWAEWVVLDTAMRVVHRDGHALSPSACDPTAVRVADFLTELPPGDYDVGLSVRAGAARGSTRLRAQVPPPDPGLRVSDLVVTCGAPESAPVAVRLAPNPAARVGPEEPLTAYFEVTGLVPGSDGLARFSYEYLVRSTERDPRVWLQRLLQPRPAAPSLFARREDENPGELRRQFLRVPVRSLPAGRYRLELRVRDLSTGAEVRRTADFERSGG